MTDDGVGRLLVASLHQGIADLLPTRLEFYESWLNPSGLREGRIGLAPLAAVLSFLRQEGEAYRLVAARAGEYSAEWTVAELPALELCFDVVSETLSKTNLGALSRGDEVHVERSVRVGDRIDGHFVQGHVDGVGTIEGLRQDGDAHWLTISFPMGLAPFFIPKGSVAVDGISLTVAALRERQFDVMIIPFTWAHTNLSSLRVDDRVNLECDMLGKYVVRAMELEEVKGQMAKVKG